MSRRAGGCRYPALPAVVLSLVSELSPAGVAGAGGCPWVGAGISTGEARSTQDEERASWRERGLLL